jgi:hypothetical protein
MSELVRFYHQFDILRASVLAECDLWRLPVCESVGNVVGRGLQLVHKGKPVSGGL